MVSPFLLFIIVAIGRPNYGDTFDKHCTISDSSVIIAQEGKGDSERKKKTIDSIKCSNSSRSDNKHSLVYKYVL